MHLHTKFLAISIPLKQDIVEKTRKRLHVTIPIAKVARTECMTESAMAPVGPIYPWGIGHRLGGLPDQQSTLSTHISAGNETIDERDSSNDDHLQHSVGKVNKDYSKDGCERTFYSTQKNSTIKMF